MQTLMFVSFAFYSATNIVFADVKDGKKLSIQLIRVSRTSEFTSEFLSIFADQVFVRNNYFCVHSTLEQFATQLIVDISYLFQKN